MQRKGYMLTFFEQISLVSKRFEIIRRTASDVLTSNRMEPLLSMSNALNKKCAYVVASEKKLWIKDWTLTLSGLSEKQT